VFGVSVLFAGEVTMAASSPLVLGLGLGLGGRGGGGERDADVSPATVTPKRPSALTFMQQQELEHQVLIYRYFAAGAPVPVHLVLPIWKSVAASSFGPQRFPSRKHRQKLQYLVFFCLFLFCFSTVRHVRGTTGVVEEAVWNE
jgi:hypothetical protein